MELRLDRPSSELRFSRQKFKYKSNFENGQKLKAAKKRFKIPLNKSVTDCMENYLSSLGQKRGREFWGSYKTLLNTKQEEVHLIRSKEGRLLNAPEPISEKFETTFFGGEHLKKQIFNDSTQLQVEAKINQLHDNPELDNEVFHEITINELKNAVLKSSNRKSFDIDGLHVTMIKNLGTKALFFLLTIFNACWNIMCGHGRSHESSSYANQTKRDVMNALHLDHTQSPVISAKRWKEYL